MIKRLNTNCLMGYACPKCGNDDELLIRGTMWMSLTDQGTDPYTDATKMCGDVEYSGLSETRCPKCDFMGTLDDFRIKED